MNKLCLLAAAFALSGCVLPVMEEPRFPEETLNAIQAGTTREADVVSALGEPEFRKEEAGKPVFVYTWSQTFFSVLMVGVAVGQAGPAVAGTGNVANYHLLKIWFDEEDTVERMEEETYWDKWNFVEAVALEGDPGAAATYARRRYERGAYDEAMRHYCTAAKAGNLMAQFQLGRRYGGDWSGLFYDPPLDYARAYKWYTLAGQGLDVKEQLAELKAKMTPAQMAEAEELLKNWKEAPCGPDVAP